jgi:hypothetical protein
MNPLQWREVREIELHQPTIPNPDASHQLLAKLLNVNVAFDGAMVHIDPRPTNAPDHEAHNSEFEVYVVPASAVRLIKYMETKKEEVIPFAEYV